MISYFDFMSLGAGDLVLWVPGGYYRSVLDGPRDHGEKPVRVRKKFVRDVYESVTFPIRQRSWTGSPTTMYGYHDIRDKIRAVPKGSRRLMTPEEADRLERCGWDPEEDAKHRVAIEMAHAQRCGKNPCRSLLRAVRLVGGLGDFTSEWRRVLQAGLPQSRRWNGPKVRWLILECGHQVWRPVTFHGKEASPAPKRVKCERCRDQ